MSSRTILFAGLAVLLLAGVGAYYFFMRPDPLVSCADVQPTIVAFGDSLVAGYGVQTEDNFVSVTARTIGVPIQNLGVSGDTTAQGLVRVQKVLNAKPDIVLVVLGGNDALQRIPVTDTEQNLDAILKELHDADIHIVLAGVPGNLFNDPYKSMFERLAKKYDATLVPNILAGIVGSKELTSDQLHPNAAGSLKIAARLAPVLETVCAKK
ncbi:MAG: GDSL-like Lipase/Acylhydrolase family protein [Parcubacteria group bacterium]|nr:GDSL-like Lipase/Acylhydrolase family protein [Parcubacteria group bacterium]